jgi:hypothetical protein
MILGRINDIKPATDHSEGVTAATQGPVMRGRVDTPG